MNNKFCSRKFENFFNSISMKAGNTDSVLTAISEELCNVSDEIFLGRLDVSLIPFSSADIEPTVNFLKNLYINEKGFSLKPRISEFSTEENETLKISAYPASGVLWTDEEIGGIDFLCSNIHIFLEKARASQHMKKLKFFDPLTKILNHAGYIKKGEELFKNGKLKAYSAIYMNIRSFKYILKNCGPNGGDILLKKYSEQISNYLQNKGIIARLMGDTFLILINSSHLNEFLSYISSVKINLSDNDSEKVFYITTVSGIYTIQNAAIDIKEAVNYASIAFQYAKLQPQLNYVFFNNNMYNQIIVEKEITVNFPKALADCEFVVYYQPKVRLSDNSICGSEALARWIRNGKVISPGDFIPVLERCGNICSLDFYMLETVCSHIRMWLDNGIKPVKTSVNFSKEHLKNQNFAKKLLNVLDKYKISSKYIEVELTETTSAENYSDLNNFVLKMKEKGLTTSIDDFGTGYSSLNLIKNLDVDIIKLDKSFLDSEIISKNDKVVIKSIVDMVNGLNMDIIAEGVETKSQAEFLKTVNCNMAQGYLFDMPLSHDEFEHRLVNQKPYNFI